ncbi:MAG: UrcA family protein [Sphingomonadales bacterium]|nr:UrcA family protein [Sphingomonadales bacterium]MDE2169796.1 UrcA family protein [Sphingomonadales bacterium]
MTGICCSISRSTMLAAAMLALSPAAHAQGADPDIGRAPQVAIDLAGVDLTTPEGAQAARHRISGAAWVVCNQPDVPDPLHLARLACVNRARLQGYRQLAELQQHALARRAQPASRGDHALTRR